MHGADNVTFCSLFAKPLNFSHFTGILWLNMQTLNVSCTCFLYTTYHFHEIVIVCMLKIEQTNCKRKSSSFREICMHIHHALAQRESPKCPFNSAVKIVYINTADKICLLWQTLKMQKKPFESFGVLLFSSFQLEIFIIFTLLCDTLSDTNDFQRTNVDIFYMIKLFKYFPVKFHSFQK